MIDLGLNFYTELLASHQLVLLRAEIKSELLSKDGLKSIESNQGHISTKCRKKQ